MPEELKVIADDKNICGEAPIWEPGRGRVIWADSEDAKVFQFMPGTRAKSVISTGIPVNGIALHKAGHLVFGGPKGLILWKGLSDYKTIVEQHEGERLSFNDIVADVKGRVYAGTYYWGPEGRTKLGKLYVIETDGRVRVVDEGIQLSNGLGFSPDDRTLYLADSAARVIYAYDYNAKTGNLTRKRPFVKIPPEDGIADGLTVDAAGYVWVAMWYGGQIIRFDPDGRIERRLPVPAKQVSSLAFAGQDLRDLYITTAATHWPSPLMPPGYDPNQSNLGGALYRVHLITQGRLEHQANIG